MFSSTPIYDVADGVVFGLMRPALIIDPTDKIYVVPQGGEHRFDLISDLFYGTPHLWWVVASVNNIVDPLVGVVAGTKIRIPTRERLSAEGILNG